MSSIAEDYVHYPSSSKEALWDERFHCLDAGIDAVHHANNDISMAVSAIREDLADVSNVFKELKHLRAEPATSADEMAVSATAKVRLEDTLLLLCRRLTGQTFSIAETLGNEMRRIQRKADALAIGSALAPAIMICISFLMLNMQLSSQIRVLAQGMARVSAGHLGHRVGKLGDDELGKLGDYFDKMAMHLEQSQQNLSQEIEDRCETKSGHNLCK